MKYIDEYDIELVNQKLSFDTTDSHIQGTIDLFTTKAITADRKLYKTIDKNLDQYIHQGHNSNHNNNNTTSTNSNPISDESRSNSTEFNINSDFIKLKRRSSSYSSQNMKLSSSNPNSNQISNNGHNTNNNKSRSRSFLNNQSGSISSSSNNNSPYSAAKSLLDDIPKLHISSKYNNQNNYKITKKKRRCSEIKVEGYEDDEDEEDEDEEHHKEHQTQTKVQFQDPEQSQEPEIPDDNSPFGPLSLQSSRRLFAYLIAILNATYPDHDFSFLQPQDFTLINSTHDLTVTINSLLTSLGQSNNLDLDWIWSVINTHMDLSHCICFQYEPTQSFLNDMPGTLWYNMYFIYNKKLKRVAFIYIQSKLLDGVNDSGMNLRIRRNSKIGTLDEQSNEFDESQEEYDLRYDDDDNSEKIYNDVFDDSDEDIDEDAETESTPDVEMR